MELSVVNVNGQINMKKLQKWCVVSPDKGSTEMNNRVRQSTADTCRYCRTWTGLGQEHS